MFMLNMLDLLAPCLRRKNKKGWGGSAVQKPRGQFQCKGLSAAAARTASKTSRFGRQAVVGVPSHASLPRAPMQGLGHPFLPVCPSEDTSANCQEE